MRKVFLLVQMPVLFWPKETKWFLNSHPHSRDRASASVLVVKRDIQQRWMSFFFFLFCNSTSSLNLHLLDSVQPEKRVTQLVESLVEINVGFYLALKVMTTCPYMGIQRRWIEFFGTSFEKVSRRAGICVLWDVKKSSHLTITTRYQLAISSHLLKVLY